MVTRDLNEDLLSQGHHLSSVIPNLSVAVLLNRYLLIGLCVLTRPSHRIGMWTDLVTIKNVRLIRL